MASVTHVSTRCRDARSSASLTSSRGSSTTCAPPLPPPRPPTLPRPLIPAPQHPRQTLSRTGSGSTPSAAPSSSAVSSSRCSASPTSTGRPRTSSSSTRRWPRSPRWTSTRPSCCSAPSARRPGCGACGRYRVSCSLVSAASTSVTAPSFRGASRSPCAGTD